jgi:hypothetical protein
MKAVAQQPQELSVEERNLLSVAYKNVIGERLFRFRVLCGDRLSALGLSSLGDEP